MGRRWAAFRLAAITVLAACLGALAGCRPPATAEVSARMANRHVDLEWFRGSFVRDTLAPWLAAAPTECGFFRATHDRQWRPAEKQTATLVSQSRLLFVMRCGFGVTGDDRYRQACLKGADFLLRHFRDEKHGGWCWSAGPEGNVLEDHKSSYGHAFVIFGLSHAWLLTREARFLEAAGRTWDEMKRSLRDGQGGIKPATTRDFSQVKGVNTQNPMMHLFEALLVMHEATDSAGDKAAAATVRQDIVLLHDFIFGRLFDRARGCLPEMYDADWKPLPLEKGGKVDVGHQFEWAYLLSHAVERGFPKAWLRDGERMLDWGMNAGFDSESGGLFSPADYGGKVDKARAKGWWEQCEHLRAVMHWAARRRRPDLWPAFEKSLAFVKARMIDAEYGGWYGNYDGRPRTDANSGKGSVWKIGYHDAGMYMEALETGSRQK